MNRIIAAICFIALVPLMPSATMAGSIEKADFLSALSQGKKIQVLDVRTPAEFAQGHVPGAKNLPLATLENENQLVTSLQGLDPKAEVYLVCTAGGPRSQRAQEILARHGFKKARFVKEGFLGYSGLGGKVAK